MTTKILTPLEAAQVHVSLSAAASIAGTARLTLSGLRHVHHTCNDHLIVDRLSSSPLGHAQEIYKGIQEFDKAYGL